MRDFGPANDRIGSWSCKNALKRRIDASILATQPRLVISPSLEPFLSARASEVNASASPALCFKVEGVKEGDYALITARSG